MSFISEVIINRAAERMSDFDEEWEAFQREQPLAAAYLLSDTFDVLTVAEKDYLLYLASVIRQAFLIVKSSLPPTTEAMIGALEEANYETMTNVSAHRFRDKLDAFFENTPQEDLLAFIEDALTLSDDDDDDAIPITAEGREPIFIGLKTLVDAWDKGE